MRIKKGQSIWIFKGTEIYEAKITEIALSEYYLEGYIEYIKVTTDEGFVYIYDKRKELFYNHVEHENQEAFTYLGSAFATKEEAKEFAKTIYLSILNKINEI